MNNNIKKSGNKLYYAKIEFIANEIREGKRRLSCLAPREEKGRNEGGSLNVESSCILGGGASASGASISSIDQEIVLESYAKYKSVWYDYVNDIKWKWDKIGSGGEALVFLEPNGEYVRKVIKYSNWSRSPIEFINNRISLYNALFPETKYELLGFTKHILFEKGKEDFCFILKQPFIKTDAVAVQSDLDDKLKKMDFLKKESAFYYNDKYVLKDIALRNVIKNNNELFFIDAVVSLNTEDKNLGGKMKYRKFRIVKNL
jgi:hypothetical protein